MSYTLGVDLGTVFTAAATHADGRTDIVQLGTRSPEIPSLVFVRPDGTVLVGEAAARRGAAEPARLAREFKRRVGDPVPVLVGGTPYSAHALLARVLAEVLATVTRHHEGPPASVTVAHPANWGPYKRELLQQTVQLAGLDSAGYCAEPAAAAGYYATGERIRTGEIVAVYDLGGGTFDAAVLSKTAQGFELLGEPAGVEQLGGIDFDEAVLGRVTEVLGSVLDGLDPQDPLVVEALSRLRRECVEAKEALSVDTEATVAVTLPHLHTRVRINRSEFEAMIRPALADSIGAMHRALRSAGVEPSQLRSILLAGGSSRIPLVSELLSVEFGRPVVLDSHPEHSVALGAALFAAGAAALTSAPGAAAATTATAAGTSPATVRTDPAGAGPATAATGVAATATIDTETAIDTATTIGAEARPGTRTSTTGGNAADPTTPDGPTKGRPAKDRPAKDRPAKDGPPKDGPAKGTRAKNGPAPGGAAKGAAVTGGATTDSPRDSGRWWRRPAVLAAAAVTVLVLLVGVGLAVLRPKGGQTPVADPPASPAAVTKPFDQRVLSPADSGTAATANAGFGSAVAAADFDRNGYVDIVVGAPLASTGGTAPVPSGSVSVFPGGAGGPGPGRQLLQGEAGKEDEANDQFGAALATGDFDSDTYPDLAVGIPGEVVGTRARSGALVVFHGSPSGLGRPRDIKQSTFGGTDRFNDDFGRALAAGDFDGDRRTDLAVGTPGKMIDGIRGGQVMVLKGTPRGLVFGWTIGQEAAGDRNEEGDLFGFALAAGNLVGAPTGRIHDDLAIGTPGERPGSEPRSGMVFVVPGAPDGTDPGFGVHQQGNGGRNEPGDRFGAALATGDFDRDGRDDLAVGIPDEAPRSDPRAGTLTVFAGGAQRLAEGFPLEARDTGIEHRDGALFASALAAGDVNGDRYADLLVGSPGWSGRAGRLYLFMGGPVSRNRPTSLTPGIQIDEPEAAGQPRRDDRFGAALVLADLDKDGTADAVVGSPGKAARPGQPRAGVVVTLTDVTS